MSDKPISLKKGDTVSLVKKSGNSPLTKIHVGLGWDVHNDIQADLDAFVVQLDQDNKVIDTVYFNHLTSDDRAIKHTGDNLTGEGDGDDEVIYVDLDKLNPRTHRIVVAVNIYQCRLTFEDVENAFVRILDRQTKEELIHYDLSQEFGKNYSMLVGDIIKNGDGTWSFKAVGTATTDRNIASVRDSVSKGKVSYSQPPTGGSGSQQAQPQQKKGFFSRLFGL